MKQHFTLFFLASAMTCASAQEVATFEDLNAPADTYWDGSDESAMFVSGGYTFINNYVDWGGYGSWDGFAWSTMSATQYVTLDDQYNACCGHGVNGSQTFGVAYYSAYMGTEPTVIANDAEAFEAKGCYVTNSAYAYKSMAEGDAYAKKFDDTDWFLITATGYQQGEPVGSAEFYLAKDGKIVNDWQYFDLSALGMVDEIHFTLSSSDNGDWGMNTPAYFCIDNFGEAPSTVNIHNLAQQNDGRIYDLMGRRQSCTQGFTISNCIVVIRK